MTMPTLFIPHGGGPCFFMDWDPPDTWTKMGEYLRGIAATLPKPKAIVVISAHWEEPDFTVMTNPKPGLIYDYNGFPPHTYQIQYPAPGSPEVAARVATLLTSAGIAVRENAQRGFDHGVFIPFKLVYPAADIPVIQLSLKAGLDPAAHIAAGRALAPLRDEGILIVASGMSYHNLGRFFRGNDPGAQEFDDWLAAAVTAPDALEQLMRWQDAPSSRAAHPREEHLLPLMVAAGAGGGAGSRTYSDRVNGIALSGFRFG